MGSQRSSIESAGSRRSLPRAQEQSSILTASLPKSTLHAVNRTEQNQLIQTPRPHADSMDSSFESGLERLSAVRSASAQPTLAS